MRFVRVIHSFIHSLNLQVSNISKNTKQCNYKQDNKADNYADSRPRENTRYT